MSAASVSPQFTIAKYLRLSSEDNDLKESGKLESNSIGNQRNLIDAFIDSHPEFAGASIVEYLDDGWSGKNFDRPGVKSMLDHVREGKIQCIIVKDLSRFGRDYLTVGNYISRIFPFLDVRFISINDGFDSINPLDIDSLDTSFKTLLYDLYSKSLSQTVKKARAFRAGRGDFQSPFAPYGYIKNPENHSRLLIDPEAAEVVRMIFRMAGDGMKIHEIAHELNVKGIPTPMLYKRAAGCSRTLWPCINKNNIWCGTTLSKILRDEVYLGKSIFGRMKRRQIGYAQMVKVDRENWIVVENTHEAIVTQEEFDRAQSHAHTTPRKLTLNDNTRPPLAGMVFCGVCGYTMKRNRAENAVYYCGTHKYTDSFPCPSERIPESDLMDLVYKALLTEAQTALDLEQVWIAQHQTAHKDKKEAARTLAALREQYAQLELSADSLYESMVEGELTREEYISKKASVSQEIKCLSDQISELESELENAGQDGTLDNQYVNGFKKYANLELVTREVMTELLDRINVYPDKRIEIVWKFTDEYESLALSLTGEE